VPHEESITRAAATNKKVFIRNVFSKRIMSGKGKKYWASFDQMFQFNKDIEFHEFQSSSSFRSKVEGADEATIGTCEP
jgi:hypothetical protein